MFLDVTFILLSAFIFGGITAAVAGGKGNSPSQWFLIGFILGPLGLVFSLVSTKNEQSIENKKLKVGDFKKCLYCAELIKIDAKVCKHCYKEQNLIDSKENIELHKKLQSSIANNDIESVKLILDSGININEFKSPISHIEYAELYNHEEIIELLKSLQTKVNDA